MDSNKCERVKVLKGDCLVSVTLYFSVGLRGGNDRTNHHPTTPLTPSPTPFRRFKVCYITGVVGGGGGGGGGINPSYSTLNGLVQTVRRRGDWAV